MWREGQDCGEPAALVKREYLHTHAQSQQILWKNRREEERDRGDDLLSNPEWELPGCHDRFRFPPSAKKRDMGDNHSSILTWIAKK